MCTSGLAGQAADGVPDQVESAEESDVKAYAQRTVASEVACPALAWFRWLYVLERRWKPLAEEERCRLRQAEAVPILQEFHDWLEGVAPTVLTKSKIGEAVSYALNQREAWERYREPDRPGAAAEQSANGGLCGEGVVSA